MRKETWKVPDGSQRIAVTPEAEERCESRESNPDALRHWILSPTRPSHKDEACRELRKDANDEVPTVVPSARGGPSLPPDLARVVAVWPNLPEAIRAAIAALVQTAGGSDA